ncbi:MAG: hypothetical protein DMF69_24530, partial [Acidobacteria bacterium]
PYPSIDRPLKLRPDRVPSYGAGSSLNPELRQRVEASFGQDFGHVRVHSGGESQAMTDAFGADGLTTGSHIFMRPNLDRERGRGARVFQHELTHVVQQSGPRPLGTGASQIPVNGQPEMGLNFNPTREAMADRVAESANQPVGPGSVETGGQKEVGLQPSGLNLFTVAKLLRTVTDLPELKRREEILDKIKKQAKIPKRAKASVEKTLDVLNDLQGNSGILKFSDVFTDAIPLVHTRLRTNVYADPIRLAAFEIAREGLVDLPTPKPVKGTAPSPSKAVDQVLNPTHFARQLESYILAKTGIVLALTPNLTKVPAPSGVDVETVDDTKPISEMKLLHIYLPYIDGRSPLWMKAVENTWPGRDEKTLSKIRVQLRAHHERKGVVAGIWAMFGKAYMFSMIFTKEVDALVKAAVSGRSLDPKDLPSTDEYAKTDKTIASPIGVRLATYDDTSQKGAGRHSHHLTQYLIADFFANTNTVKPFETKRTYPGVTFGTDGVTTIAEKPGETSRDKAIYVGETKGEGRGKDNSYERTTAHHSGGR